MTAGDRIYFRVGAIDDGVSDSVAWNPVITYQSPTWPELDANGLSQWAFSAESDFTLAGRPDDFVAMPYTGDALVEGAVVTSAPLTDALTVVAVKRDPTDNETPFVLGTIPEGTAGRHLPVHASRSRSRWSRCRTRRIPRRSTSLTDKLSVYVAVDSPVDLSAIDFSGTITYASIVDATGNEEFEHHIRPHVEIYPYANMTTGAVPDHPVRQQNVSSP